RRHTRSKRDWSSDVCSSDLKQLAEVWQLPKAISTCGLHVQVFILNALRHHEDADERNERDGHAVGSNRHRGVEGGVEDFCDHWCEGAADDGTDRVADRDARQSDLNREHFGEKRTHRAVCWAKEGYSDDDGEVEHRDGAGINEQPHRDTPDGECDIADDEGALASDAVG